MPPTAGRARPCPVCFHDAHAGRCPVCGGACGRTRALRLAAASVLLVLGAGLTLLLVLVTFGALGWLTPDTAGWIPPGLAVPTVIGIGLVTLGLRAALSRGAFHALERRPPRRD